MVGEKNVGGRKLILKFPVPLVSVLLYYLILFLVSLSIKDKIFEIFEFLATKQSRDW